MNIKTTLKSSVAAAALFAIAAPVAPSVNAADDTLKSGNKNSLTLSGQVVRSLFYADNGQTESLFHADGGITKTRVRWVAKGSVNENVTTGATIEMDVPLSNPEGSLTLNNQLSAGASVDSATQTTWTVRHQFVWVNHKRMGKLSLGHTNTASNGRSETTFSGVNMAADSGGVTFGSGIRFIDVTTANTQSISTITVGSVFTNLDGRSRNDVLRYDTPRFSGMALAVSAIAGGDWDVGADYRMKSGPIRVRIQAQYNNNASTSGTVGSSHSISGAALHDSGVNAALSWGQQSLIGESTAGTDEPHYLDIDIGYRAKIFGVGGTNFSFNVNHTTDLQQNDSEARSIGVTVAQLFAPIGGSMALTYKNYSFDTSTNTFEDIDVLSLQTIFSF